MVLNQTFKNSIKTQTNTKQMMDGIITHLTAFNYKIQRQTNKILFIAEMLLHLETLSLTLYDILCWLLCVAGFENTSSHFNSTSAQELFECHYNYN